MNCAHNIEQMLMLIYYVCSRSPYLTIPLLRFKGNIKYRENDSKQPFNTQKDYPFDKHY